MTMASKISSETAACLSRVTLSGFYSIVIQNAATSAQQRAYKGMLTGHGDHHHTHDSHRSAAVRKFKQGRLYDQRVHSMLCACVHTTCRGHRSILALSIMVLRQLLMTQCWLRLTHLTQRRLAKEILLERA